MNDSVKPVQILSAPWTAFITALYSASKCHILRAITWPYFPSSYFNHYLSFWVLLITTLSFLYTQTYASLSIYNCCPQRSSCRKMCTFWHIKEQRLMLPLRKLSIPISILARDFSIQQNRVSMPLPRMLMTIEAARKIYALVLCFHMKGLLHKCKINNI